MNIIAGANPGIEEGWGGEGARSCLCTNIAHSLLGGSGGMLPQEI